MEDIETKATALVLIVLILSIGGFLLLARYTDHRFDIACFNSGKTIQYRVLEGRSERVKECK